jgi:hypothetical protein|tara:strand:+ start:283 stop:459 length:177 start_codon:yes stop_codon:yes gene_type:complete
MKKIKQKLVEQKEILITRRVAVEKLGKYAAVTAIGTFLILNPKKAQAMSSAPPPGGGF